jgi:hypothetical protein
LGIEVDWSWLSSISSCPSNLILDDFNRTSWASHRDPWDLCRAAISNKPSWLFNTFTPPTWWMMDGQPKRWPKTRGGQPISVVSTLLCYVNLIAFILHIYIIYIYNYIYISIYKYLWFTSACTIPSRHWRKQTNSNNICWRLKTD